MRYRDTLERRALCTRETIEVICIAAGFDPSLIDRLSDTPGPLLMKGCTRESEAERMGVPIEFLAFIGPSSWPKNFLFHVRIVDNKQYERCPRCKVHFVEGEPVRRATDSWYVYHPECHRQRTKEYIEKTSAVEQIGAPVVRERSGAWARRGRIIKKGDSL